MNETKTEKGQLDPREFELPETVYSLDIEDQVLHGIVIKTLSKIPRIGLLEGSFLDNLMGRLDRVKGISTEQDPTSAAVKIHIAVKVHYGVNIPQKAEEIQSAIVEDITKLTGMRVAEVYVIFKDLITEEKTSTLEQIAPTPEGVDRALEEELENEFS